MKFSELINTGDWKVRSINMTSTRNLEAAVNSLLAQYDAAPIDDEEDLLGQLKDFKNRIESNNWRKYPWHKAATLMRSLFNSEHLDDAQWREVVKTLLNSLKTTDKKSFLKAAFEVYCLNYTRKSEFMAELSNILRQHSIKDLPIPSFFKSNLDLFDRNTAHRQLGEYLSKCDLPFIAMKGHGVTNPHAKGLFELSFISMVQKLEPELVRAKPDAVKKVKNWLAPNSKVYASYSSNVGIDALISHLEKNGTQEQRDDLRNFLVENFRDPRVSKARWHGVSEQALNIINQWLTTKSLSVFFDIIDRFEESHMWANRRTFWTELNQEKQIDNAWVILSPNGSSLASEIARERNDSSYLSHGKVGSKYRQDSDEKCYFVMRIGDLTVVEGTHSFKVRLFKSQNQNAPDLFRTDRIYYRDELAVQDTKCDAAFIHDRPGRWMRTTRDYIRRNR